MKYKIIEDFLRKHDISFTIEARDHSIMCELMHLPTSNIVDSFSAPNLQILFEKLEEFISRS